MAPGSAFWITTFWFWVLAFWPDAVGKSSMLVVSLIPNFNRALAESLALARPGVPFVTVLTDMADHPPHFWVEPGVAQHLVCGTAHALQQALDALRRDVQSL